MVDISISNNHTDEILKALFNAKDRGLKACGETAVRYAQQQCPVDTGRLRASITYAVEGDDCYIGTNVEYAPYVELGTGRYTSGGRQTPWVYQDDKGEWHKTTGQAPRPFLVPSATEHTAEYQGILKDSLANA